MKLIPTKVLLLIIVCLSLSVAEGSGDLSVSGTSALTVSGLAVSPIQVQPHQSGVTALS